ncbi:MAG TPA: hypothetical protein VF546_11295 [Pyrinomonadaceae bacterium]|jgi:uncharacterized membrane protein
MQRLLRQLDYPIVLALFLTGAAFLLKMCYLRLVPCTLAGAAWLAAVYLYLRARYDVRLPAGLLLLVFAAVEVDALGNYFRLYGRAFGPLQYDEFAHMLVQALVTPLLVWLLGRALAYAGLSVPLGFTVAFALTLVFSLSAFYEIVELWDELYFGGRRIWGPYDAPNDLQWDLLGIICGSLLAYALLKTRPRRALA